MKQEIEEIIKKHLSQEVGETLKKTLQQAEIDAVTVKNQAKLLSDKDFTIKNKVYLWSKQS